jgi:hypothetical protein
MACIHKFASHLHLDRLDFEPTTLIVGTFNPNWVSLGNYAQWFYGRTNNNYFWDVLPRLYGSGDLRQVPSAAWKAFCSQHKIALTDLIISIDDADSNNPLHVKQLKNYRDDAIASYFRQFTVVGIKAILINHPSIRHVYLTRQLGSEFWQKKWLPVTRYCNEYDIRVQPLLTPSGGARFQMTQSVDISMRNFIFNHWQKSWHTL